MSWPDMLWPAARDSSGLSRRPALALIAVALACAPLLGACGATSLRPLHANAGYGSSVSQKMAAVKVSPIPGRVGQRLRNELMFQATSGDTPVPPEYRLEIAIRESLSSTLIERTGEPSAQVYNLEASFHMVSLADNKVVLTGKSFGRASFERFESIFANVRAQRDAEDRAANTVGTELKTRIESFLASAA